MTDSPHIRWCAVLAVVSMLLLSGCGDGEGLRPFARRRAPSRKAGAPPTSEIKMRPLPEKGLPVLQRIAHAGGVTEVRYANGLTLLCKENFAAPVIAMRVFVGIGSIYEGDMLGSGISHYFEHVISGGTTRNRTEVDSNKILRRIGNNANAYTTLDKTVYLIDTEKRYFPVAAALLGDYMANCVIDMDEFQRERGVIIQEIRKNLDNPYRQLFQLLNETMFPGHPLEQPVIGHEELFRKVTRNQLAALYRRYYVGPNMTVVAVGAVPTEEMIDVVGRAFLGVRGAPVRLPELPDVAPQTEPRTAEKRSPSVRQAYLAVGHHTIPLDHPDLYALDTAAAVLGSGRSSRLKRALQDPGIVQTIACYSHTPHYGAGVFGIYGTLPDASVEETLTVIDREIERLRTERVSEPELARAKKRIVTSQVFGIETAQDQAADMGGNYYSTGDPNFTTAYIDGIKKVTVEEILDVARRYLSRDNRTTALIRPDAGGPVSEAGADRATRTVEKITLDNGLRILWGHDPNVESVLVQAAFLGGVFMETDRDNGVSALMSDALLHGTETRDRHLLHSTVDSLGARLGSRSGNNSWYVNIKLLPEDVTRGMEILADVVQRPAFPERDFLQERAKQLAMIKAADDAWEQEASRFFRKVFYRGHPYARPQSGTVESVSGLTADDVRAFHRKTLNARSCVLAVFGNVEKRDAVAAAQQYFGDMPAFEPPALRAAPPATPFGETLVKENRKNQVVLFWGFEGIPFGHPDTPALMVMDAVVSGYGYPSGYLHHALRGASDLVYLVHAYPWAGIDTGAFCLVTQTQPENVPAVRKKVEDVIRRIRRDAVRPPDLRAARESIVISDALENADYTVRATQACYDELYGLGFDFHDRFDERIRSVTAADVRRVARTYLEKNVLTATGPEAGLEQLTR